MNKIDVINNFKTKYINNMKLYSDYNDSLFNVIEFNSWKNNLINRSKSIREMFIENEKIIPEIKEVIKDLDDDCASLLVDTIKLFNKENIHDNRSWSFWYHSEKAGFVFSGSVVFVEGKVDGGGGIDSSIKPINL